MKADTAVTSIEKIAPMIRLIRGQRVLLDADLALMHGVQTRSLNQAVKRNLARFPGDFFFQFTPVEKIEVITNCDHLRNLRFVKAALGSQIATLKRKRSNRPQFATGFQEHGNPPSRADSGFE